VSVPSSIPSISWLFIYTATMQFKAFATLLFAALAVANPAPGPAPQADDDLDGLLDSIPSSVLVELMTAIPPSVIAAFANPTQASSIVNEIDQGHIPDWYSSLPADVKAWASSAAMEEIAGVSATTTLSGSSATTTGAAATAVITSSHSETPSSARNTASVFAGASSTSTPSSTSSHNAAATGAVAVSFAGAAGVLAVALAL
jgi:hypothetical protein